MHDSLHWLDVLERAKYKVINSSLLHWYRADSAPVSEVAQRRHLHSAACHQLVVPSYRLNSCGLRAFSVLGPIL